MTDRTTIASADLSDGLPRLTPEGTSHEPKLGLIKPHGGSERMVRESAPPHYLEVVHKAHGLMAEIEEALGMSGLQKKAAVALLARSYELNRVLLGNEAMAAKKEGAA